MSRAAGRETEFVGFAGAAAPCLRRTAYLMCGDWHLAEDLSQTALAKVYVAWRRSGAPDDPIAYARTALLRSMLNHRRRRSTGELPVAELPEREAGSGDDDLRLTMLGALARLTVAIAPCSCCATGRTCRSRRSRTPCG